VSPATAGIVNACIKNNHTRVVDTFLDCKQNETYVFWAVEGPIGLTGLDGAQGPIGLTGATGVNGANGLQGPIGLTGANGIQGPIGLTGATGVNGANGLQGPIGLTGATGPAGGGGDAWLLAGNSGTTAGIDFLGTTDNQPLELHVGGTQAFRIEPGPFGTSNVIGGGSSNSAIGAAGGVIAGGTNNTVSDFNDTVGGGDSNTAGGGTSTVSGGIENSAFGASSTIGGGEANLASGDLATVGGGELNTATKLHSTVGGGDSNIASADRATVAGGKSNVASGQNAAIGGGRDNTAAGFFGTVPGGESNAATGGHSIASGFNAQALHDGANVWADSTGAVLASTAANQYLVRASGGVTFYSNAAATVGVTLDPGGSGWNVTSDRNAKSGLQTVDPRDIVERLASIPISTYSYETQDGVRHLGPMAQDFAAAFGLGVNDTTINTVDADGVSLAAIQGLYGMVLEKDAQIAAMQDRLETLEGAGVSASSNGSSSVLQSNLWLAVLAGMAMLGVVAWGYRSRKSVSSEEAVTATV
ncbi:MAG: tail fiber domain-containing protein, partial [Chloroflexi bacterium]|nr:tail fiber domain-containing protein [Chloroflexota bacterium]